MKPGGWIAIALWCVTVAWAVWTVYRCAHEIQHGRKRTPTREEFERFLDDVTAGRR